MEHIPLFVQNSRIGLLFGTVALGLVVYSVRRYVRSLATGVVAVR